MSRKWKGGRGKERGENVDKSVDDRNELKHDGKGDLIYWLLEIKI